MGQHQLLLLVLGTLILGITVVSGLSAFTSNERKSRKDLANSKMTEIAGRAIAWCNKPRAMGGGKNADGSSSFEGLTLQNLGLTNDSYLYLSDGSCITSSVAESGARFDISWQPNGDCGLSNDVLFSLQVSGTSPEDVVYSDGNYNWD